MAGSETRSDIREVHTVLGNYPYTEGLKDGSIEATTVRLKFTEVDPVHDAFDAMVREQAYDVCELAIGTFLQARAAHKPVVLLPLVMAGAFHHGSICFNPKRGQLRPEDLEGRRVGVRAYSQTTGLWVRGILQEEFGVRLGRVTWVTTEGAHVAEYVDPDNVERAEGHDLREMLRAGDIDAAIIGQRERSGTEFAPLIADPKAAALAWYQRHGVVPINHMVVVKESLAREEPQVMQDVYDLLSASCAEAASAPNPSSGGASALPEPNRVGKANVKGALELAARYALQQGLIPQEVDLDACFPAALVDR